jgi:hypothetical protein
MSMVTEQNFMKLVEPFVELYVERWNVLKHRAGNRESISKVSPKSFIFSFVLLQYSYCFPKNFQM